MKEWEKLQRLSHVIPRELRKGQRGGKGQRHHWKKQQPRMAKNFPSWGVKKATSPHSECLHQLLRQNNKTEIHIEAYHSENSEQQG